MQCRYGHNGTRGAMCPERGCVDLVELFPMIAPYQVDGALDHVIESTTGCGEHVAAMIERRSCMPPEALGFAGGCWARQHP